MQRWLALDRLRATAVLLMVQGHTFTAFLRPDALATDLNRLHALLHGLTAPAFLFGAGLAFGVATYPQYERYRAPGSALRKRLGRYLTLLLIGYALQLPGGSLWAAFHVEGEQLALVCRVGPLQLIALTLGMCQLAILAVPTARRHALLAAGLGLIVMLSATHVCRSGAAANLGRVFGSFVDDSGGSQFPVFPWASFALFGVGCAGFLHQRPHVLRALPFVCVGGLLTVLTYLAFRHGIMIGDRRWFWRASPLYVMFRLGMVLVLLGSMHRRADSSTKAAPSGLTAALARHSLVAYVVHLLLLYGTPLTPNFARIFATSLSLPTTGLVCAGVLLVTVGATLLWDHLERTKLLTVRYKRVGLVLASLVVLVR